MSERMSELYLVFSAIFKCKIQRTKNKTIKYKKQKYKMQKMQNATKLIIESINITKNIVWYSKYILLIRA